MRYLLLFLAFLAAGCSAPPADPEREAQATAAYEHLAAGRFDDLRSTMTPSTAAAADDATLQQLADYAPSGRPEASQLATWRWHRAGDVGAYETVQEFTYPDRVVVWQTTMVQQGGGPWRIDGVNINSASDEAVELARFSLSGRPLQNYLVLAAAVAAPVLCLVTVVVAGWRRRWLWMILSLFGFGQFTLNWATGEVAFELARFALFSAGFMKMGGSLDPWFIFFAVPAPAILFWLLGRWRPKPVKVRKASGLDEPPV